MILGESEAEIRWFVPKEMPPGKYRISHSGSHKPLLDSDVKFFIGYTNDFEVNLSVEKFCTYIFFKFYILGIHTSIEKQIWQSTGKNSTKYFHTFE